jgi:cytochrome c553
MRWIIIASAALASLPASAQSQSEARNLASACAICHGTQGKPAPSAPLIPLAGLPRDHIVSQMQAFREGRRPATVMHQIAKGYSDAEIQAMAAWFAAQKR